MVIKKDQWQKEESFDHSDVLHPKVKEGGGMTNRKETLKTGFQDV
jgi:hypothetical protein